MQQSTTEQHLTREGASAYLEVSIGTFSALCKAGKIKGYKTPGKKLVYTKADLDKFLQSCQPAETN